MVKDRQIEVQLDCVCEEATGMQKFALYLCIPSIATHGIGRASYCLEMGLHDVCDLTSPEHAASVLDEFALLEGSGLLIANRLDVRYAITESALNWVGKSRGKYVAT